MFTVGLLSQMGITTFNYDSIELAQRKLEGWKKSFMTVHSVEFYTTIIERDGCDIIKSVQYRFSLKDEPGLYCMFLSKSRN